MENQGGLFVQSALKQSRHVRQDFKRSLKATIHQPTFDQKVNRGFARGLGPIIMV